MRSSEFRSCPGCSRESEATSDSSSKYVVAECSKCGFSATTRDVAEAEYLANFIPLPDIRTAAARIANRSMLNYSEQRRRAS